MEWLPVYNLVCAATSQICSSKDRYLLSSIHHQSSSSPPSAPLSLSFSSLKQPSSCLSSSLSSCGSVFQASSPPCRCDSSPSSSSSSSTPLTLSSFPRFLPPYSGYKDMFDNYYRNFQYRFHLRDAPTPSLSPFLSSSSSSSSSSVPRKKKIVVLGSGWGAASFLRYINVDKYDITVISPRNYFTYTPLLPSVCASSLSASSCISPVRYLLKRGGKQVMNFVDSQCVYIDAENNKCLCVNINQRRDQNLNNQNRKRFSRTDVNEDTPHAKNIHHHLHHEFQSDDNLYIDHLIQSYKKQIASNHQQSSISSFLSSISSSSPSPPPSTPSSPSSSSSLSSFMSLLSSYAFISASYITSLCIQSYHLISPYINFWNSSPSSSSLASSPSSLASSPSSLASSPSSLSSSPSSLASSPSSSLSSPSPPSSSSPSKSDNDVVPSSLQSDRSSLINDDSAFLIDYDYLIVGVGCITNTFNIPGVDKYSFFLKDINDAISIQNKIKKNLEIASLPSTSIEEKKKLCHIVVCGGGPTGVEAAGEIADFFAHDGSFYYPELKKYFKVTIVEMLDKLISMYNKQTQLYAKTLFQTNPYSDVLLKHKVKEITKNGVLIQNMETPQNKQEVILHSNCVIWASGIGCNPLVRGLIKDIKEKTNCQGQKPVLMVDQNMKVHGVSNNNIYAIGDTSIITPPLLTDYAQFLANLNKKNKHTNKENEKSKNDDKDEYINLGTDYLKSIKKTIQPFFIQLYSFPINQIENKNHLNFDQFRELLDGIDKSYRSPPPTAQTAKQQGYFLCSLFNSMTSGKGLNDENTYSFCSDDNNNTNNNENSKTIVMSHYGGFIPQYKGQMVYLIDDKAAIEFPKTMFRNIYTFKDDICLLGGFFSLLLWKTIYLQLHVSNANRINCCYDWVMKFFNGRFASFDQYY